MLRFLTKGGVWRNIEDDILKAAVDRYGENQWDRIASLFHRKSAKQCKARWYELKVPSYRKIGWSSEEKVEKAESNDVIEEKCKRLKLGELDINTKYKHDEPQNVDMEEHEQEAYSDVKSRLCDTQNIKTKRKVCDKQLIEAGGLAALQKRKEIRVRGTETRTKVRRKHDIDLKTDKQFEKRPSSGFTETLKENSNSKDSNDRILKPLNIEIDRGDNKVQQDTSGKNELHGIVPAEIVEDKDRITDENLCIEHPNNVENNLGTDQRLKGKEELNVHSCVVERNLPRPSKINDNILRDVRPGDVPLNDLQKAEELIKREMLIMLHHDSAITEKQHGTTSSLEENIQTKQHNIDRHCEHLDFLKQYPLEHISTEDIESARNLLHAEMDIVKHGMNHGDISVERFSNIWEECYSQVLYLPSQKRYTRANLVSKRNRIDSMKHTFETNRSHMCRESKSAAKLQKQIEIQLDGYQSQSEGLLKQISWFHNKIENTHVQLKTLELLHHNETVAIHNRTESLTNDVTQQTDRQKKLLLKYNNLKEEYILK